MLTGLMAVLSGCFSFRDYAVESDYSYKGKFNKYKSFAFQLEKNDDANSFPINPLIENAIRKRLQLQGYEYDAEKPELMVSYKIFSKDLKMLGYYQPSIEQWMKDKKLATDYEPAKFKLKKGAISISFIDHNTHTVIWHGFASSKIASDSPMNRKYLQFAIRSILDQYRVFANQQSQFRTALN